MAAVNPLLDHARAYPDDSAWCRALDERIAHVDAGELAPKLRELTYVVGYLIADDADALRWHRDRATAQGATDDDFRLILRLLDFYRGLRGMQDAQKVISFWRTGNFPEIKPPRQGSVAAIFDTIVATRRYVANGFRVYAADGEWLRLYLERSDAIRRAPRTVDERGVQLLAMAITLANHRYSNNWNDGCISVHEDKARALGATEAEVLEVLQILEICQSVATTRHGARRLGLLEQ